MHDFTNLSWPDGPYGAEFRPFGKRQHLLTSVTVDWSDNVPVAVSVVYLRVRPATTLEVSEQSLSIGFRTTVIETGTETEAHLAHLDQVLVGARRHANVLAGYHFDRDLARAIKLTDSRLPGVEGISEAWTDRAAKDRGIAKLIDIYHDVPHDTKFEVDTPPDPLVIASAAGTPLDVSGLAAGSLGRCLAIGLIAAVHSGRFRWDGKFPVRDAVTKTAWDLFEPAASPAPTT